MSKLGLYVVGSMIVVGLATGLFYERKSRSKRMDYVSTRRLWNKLDDNLPLDGGTLYGEYYTDSAYTGPDAEWYQNCAKAWQRHEYSQRK